MPSCNFFFKKSFPVPKIFLKKKIFPLYDDITINKTNTSFPKKKKKIFISNIKQSIPEKKACEQFHPNPLP